MFRIILFIFAVSNVPVFQEETIFGVRQCELMTLSDALPVQFWLNECDTYNEHEAGGVHHECWCAPWECTDPITTQFKDTTGQTISLLIKNAEGLYLHDEVFTEVQSGVYQLTVIPDDLDICDDSIQLLIGDASSVNRMAAPSAWTDVISTFDSKTATDFIENLTSSDNVIRSKIALVVPAGTVIGISYRVNVSGTWSVGGSIPIFASFSLIDGSNNVVSTGTLSVEQKTISANGIYDYIDTITATDTSAFLVVDLIEQLNSGTAFFTLTITPGKILYISPSALLAKSDCLDVATTQDETIFMEYSNHRNFDGLVYDNASPDLTFGIRVPCRFFHEIEPEEDEAMELTSSIVTTSAQLKTQRLLEVKHSPYYFHKKLRRILKHQTITIFDKSWKKEEPYDVLEGNKRWPLKAATCYLTETNSVVRNVL